MPKARKLLRFEDVTQLTLSPRKLAWPWVWFSPDRRTLGYPVGPRALALRSIDRLDDERRIDLPAGFETPTKPLPTTGSTSRRPGLQTVALSDDGVTLVAFTWHDDGPRACVVSHDAPPRTIDLAPHLGGMGILSASFSKPGDALWASAESDTHASLLRLSLSDLAIVGQIPFAPAPLPAQHELHVHPTRDDALLLMACGQDGTFARVARFDTGVVACENALEGGAEPTGLADWNDDGERVFLIGFDGIEARTWPGLALVSQVDAPDGLILNCTGLRIGDQLAVSAADEETEDEPRALLYDATTLVRNDDAPAPPGMWAGRFGDDRLVTIDRETSGTRRAFIRRLRV